MPSSGYRLIFDEFEDAQRCFLAEIPNVPDRIVRISIKVKIFRAIFFKTELIKIQKGIWVQN